MRSLRVLLVPLMLLAVTAAAPAPPPIAMVAEHIAVMPAVRADSVSVYVVAQIGSASTIVTSAADSAAVVRYAQHAAVAVVHGLGVAQIPVVRIGWFVEAAHPDSATPASNARNPYDSWRRATASIRHTSRDSARIAVRYASR